MKLSRKEKNIKQQKISKLEKKILSKLNTEIGDTRKQGIFNTEVYLTWDYIDVYIATSMREQWEYFEVYEFINQVFSKPRIKNLNLRYFDPTQSYCSNNRDKGLLESLMLKRASCTIYLAQENDTMGKDSELAATLAQGKPVIAYVPRKDATKYSQELKKYPLDFSILVN